MYQEWMEKIPVLGDIKINKEVKKMNLDEVKILENLIAEGNISIEERVCLAYVLEKYKREIKQKDVSEIIAEAIKEV